MHNAGLKTGAPARLAFAIAATGLGSLLIALLLGLLTGTVTVAAGLVGVLPWLAATTVAVAGALWLARRLAVVAGPGRQPLVASGALSFSGQHRPDNAPSSPGSTPAQPAPPLWQTRDVTPARLHGRLLLVEDNAVNQEVVLGLLEDSHCRIDVAETGEQALAAFASGRYDLILLDCHLPGISGYQITAEIRQREQRTGRRVPIVAVTASAADYDRQRCLEAGMDDYLAKPFERIELLAKIGRWLLPRANAPQPAGSPAAGAGADDTALDGGKIAELHALTGPGRPDMVRKVADVFLEKSPALLQTLHRAGDDRDPAAIERLAHNLKSSSASIGASRLAQLCQQLEDSGRAEPLDGDKIDRLVDKITRGYAEVERALHSESKRAGLAGTTDAGDPASAGVARPDSVPQGAVLLIEDDASIRLPARKALEQSGFTVFEAGNGRQALDMLDAGPLADLTPDLILLDVLMPEMDGFATCRALRERERTALTPVLMMTGLDDLQSIDLAYETGATDFLTKPVNYSLLTHRVRYALRAQRTAADLQRSEEQVRHLAYYDAITGLPNRTHLTRRLNEMLTQARQDDGRIALFFLDLDQFKLINDTLGHSAGDQLLKQVSGRLLNCVRSHTERGDGSVEHGALPPQQPIESNSSDIVARLGGDEFVIAVDEVRKPGAEQLARRIIGALAPPFTINDNEVYVTTSIGVSLYPDDSSDFDGLLKQADAAMYHAKESGRNGYQFYSSFHDALAKHRLTLRTELRKALDLNQLELHYQPRIDADSERPVSAEALVRWRHPDRGLIYPNEFITVAEETGLIVPLGRWVLRQACADALRWQNAGLAELGVSVNLSSVQFKQNDFHTELQQILRDSGLEPQHLELELTESTLMQNTGHSVALLDRLKQLGVRLSIDDFGTGYSSLAYLRRFPIDALKVDRSFTRDVLDDVDDAAIVATTINMGHTLGLQVIAEGVENQSQLDFLREHGCDQIQGYWFSQPAVLEDFIVWLQARSAA